MMRLNSLSFRLAASSALVSLVLLICAGLLLDSLNRAIVNRIFDAQLEAVLNTLLNGAELDERNELVVAPISDARFENPLTGWYWQISPESGSAKKEVASASLLENRLRPTGLADVKRDSAGVAHFDLKDINGTDLRAMQTTFALFGGENKFSFIVTGNTNEVTQEIAAFRQALVLVLGLLGLGLLAAVLLQVRFGLRPLRKLRDEVTAIREGRSEQMKNRYPSEIQPVSDELNLLIESNEQVVERARTQVGNLAHALKTPLSVLTNEADLQGGALAAKVTEQAEVMRDQVSMYLDRARRAARAKSLGSATDARDVVDAIVRTLQRIHADRGFEVDVRCSTAKRFRGEKQDLEEMVGNLLDNAFKWANGKIVVSIDENEPDETEGRSWITVSVMDDGPGLPNDEACEKALKRGLRLDETKPGSGLGLSIVSETAGMYDGRLTLKRRDECGINASLMLPAV